MESDDRPDRGAEPGRDRLSRLSQASLRINESLDVDAALQAVMESARSLTDAPYAAIITLDASGAVEDHLVLGFDPGDVPRVLRLIRRGSRSSRGRCGRSSRSGKSPRTSCCAWPGSPRAPAPSS